MSSEAQVMGRQIEHIANQYQELEKRVKDGEDVEMYKSDLERNIAHVQKVAKQVDQGLAENEVQWYKELSGLDTTTAHEIRAQYQKWTQDTK